MVLKNRNSLSYYDKVCLSCCTVIETQCSCVIVIVPQIEHIMHHKHFISHIGTVQNHAFLSFIISVIHIVYKFSVSKSICRGDSCGAQCINSLCQFCPWRTLVPSHIFQCLGPKWRYTRFFPSNSKNSSGQY